MKQDENPVRFVKYSGAGNDFVIFYEKWSPLEPLKKEKFVKAVCARHTGIGADGVTFISEDGPHVRMEYWNSDGRRAEMCGNGLRCAGHFASRHIKPGEEQRLQADDGAHRVWVKKTTVAAEIKLSSNKTEAKLLAVEDFHVPGYLVNTGVPHFVTLEKDIHDDFVMRLAPQLRRHKALGAAGANVNFLQRIKKGVYYYRVYERGVEAETLSCGTGIAAAGLVLARYYDEPFPVKLKTKGGPFTVHKGSSRKSVIIDGPVAEVFQGTLQYKLFSS